MWIDRHAGFGSIQTLSKRLKSSCSVLSTPVQGVELCRMRIILIDNGGVFFDSRGGRRQFVAKMEYTRHILHW